MTQHVDTFLQDCTTVTMDGSLASLAELEGLYLYWCSLRSEAPLDTAELVDALVSAGMEQTRRDGVDYVEGVVLTGELMAGFILTCDFAGAWGQPDIWEFAPVRHVATAS
jgi:hypothetical protein